MILLYLYNYDIYNYLYYLDLILQYLIILNFIYHFFTEIHYNFLISSLHFLLYCLFCLKIYVDMHDFIFLYHICCCMLNYYFIFYFYLMNLRDRFHLFHFHLLYWILTLACRVILLLILYLRLIYYLWLYSLGL